MDKIKALELLKQALSEIPHLKELQYNDPEFQLWRDKVEQIIKSGLSQDDFKTFISTNLPILILDFLTTSTARQDDYLKRLVEYGVNIEKIIQKYKILGIEEEPASEKPIKEEKPKAFIAHEGETRALNILKEFLEALGIQYFIAESKASDGRSVEKQVDWTQSKADFAICLATKGKAINKKTGKHYMAPNIIDELGRARQVFGNKIILLVQKGVEVHTNIREVVYETFTTTNMERAFIKIAKELTNWEFITVGTIKEQT